MDRLDAGAADLEEGAKIEQTEAFNILTDLENKGKISTAK